MRWLGDPHNFGRRVGLEAGRVSKPRALLWEWLLLSRESPLRRLLTAAARADGLSAASFTFLPTLKFHASRPGALAEVEELTLAPLRKANHTARALAEATGRVLAFFSWFGVSDLHWENLALGLDSRGDLVFSPVDIEMILSDLALPTETHLLPDTDPDYAVPYQHACGIRRVLPFLGKPIEPEDLVAMVSSYRTLLAFLERHSTEIAAVFAGLPSLRETPIRVSLRSTAEYVHANAELWPPLLDAELEQLERSDIPYFFRLYGRPGIHYYGNAALTELKRLPLRGDVPKLEPLLPIERGLRAPSRHKLRQEGLFTVLGAFDHPDFAGRYGSAELEINFLKRRIDVRFADGEALGTRRDLRAWVSSVYLPCRCGEARSVFVPARTRCTQPLGGV